MLNAAEAAIDQAAENDTERTRNRTKLYAPPAGQRPTGGRVRPPGLGLDLAAAQALTAQLAAEDARLTRGTTG